jgi:hypothetical protein
MTITNGNDTQSRSYNPFREVKPASSVLTELEYDFQSTNNDH